MAVIDRIAQPAPPRRPRSSGRRKPTGRPPWMGAPSPTMQALKVAAIVMIGVVMLYPFLYVIMFSFADAGSVTSGQLIPTSFSIAAYE
ncbi:MAG: carbohydrate ABC transporter permease, partial [Brachybacterium sp.]